MPIGSGSEMAPEQGGQSETGRAGRRVPGNEQVSSGIRRAAIYAYTNPGSVMCAPVAESYSLLPTIYMVLSLVRFVTGGLLPEFLSFLPQI
jgi:hypothetical protein